MGEKVSMLEASRITGFSQRTLFRYVSRGYLRAFQIGPHMRLRFDTDDLRALMLKPVDVQIDAQS